MRKLTAICITAALALGAAGCFASVLAADLGAPKPAVAEANPLDTMAAIKGCYLETSVAGTFLKVGDRQATAALGGGCDAKVGVAIIGGGLRAAFGDSTTGTVYGRLGMAINPLFIGYGTVNWTVPDWKVRDVGQFNVGLGLETAVLFNGLSTFIEGTTAVGKMGRGVATDDLAITAGARVRF